jgi:hypothetical protein
MERGKSQLADGKGFDSRTSRKKIAKIGVFLLPNATVFKRHRNHLARLTA